MSYFQKKADIKEPMYLQHSLNQQINKIYRQEEEMLIKKVFQIYYPGMNQTKKEMKIKLYKIIILQYNLINNK